MTNNCTNVQQFVAIQHQLFQTSQYIKELNSIKDISNLLDLSSFEAQWTALQAKFLSDFSEIIAQIKLANDKAHEKNALYKFHQQREANGVLSSFCGLAVPNLEEIGNELNLLMDLILTARHQLGPVVELTSNGNHNLQNKIDSLIARIANDLLILEVQPSQLMKTTKPKVTPKLTFMLQHNFTKISSATATLLNTEQVQMLQVENKDIEHLPPGLGLVKNTEEFCRDFKSNRFTASFQNVQLSSVKGRATKKGGTFVAEEKYCLVFEAMVDFVGFVVKVRTFSLPISVQSHGAQDDLGVAVIMWDNAFAEMNRLPFAVPDQIEWSKLGETISNRFYTVGGRSLKEEDLKFFKNMANLGQADSITFAQFCKDPLSGRQYSLWTWIFHVLRLISKDCYVRQMWMKGHFLGFIGRENAETMLWSCLPGTFLLRFSESILGSVSITPNLVKNNQTTVVSTVPRTQAQLAVTPLPKIIMGLPTLKFIYPATPKETVFHDFVPQTTVTPPDPYKEIKMVIDVGSSDADEIAPNPPASQPCYSNNINPEMMCPVQFDILENSLEQASVYPTLTELEELTTSSILDFMEINYDPTFYPTNFDETNCMEELMG